MNTKQINKNLVEFWEKALYLKEEEKEELLKENNLDYKDFVSSEQLYDAITALKDCKNVLDYGCGSAWASIILAKEGCSHIDALDMSDGIIDAAKFYTKLFDVDKNVYVSKITDSLKKSIQANSYDGLVCINVLDVVTDEVSDEIIKFLYYVLSSDAKIIIGTNYYLSKEDAFAKGLDLKDGKYIFRDGVLRLNSLSNEEWKNKFLPYFEIVDIKYYAWPNEEKEARRIFYLKRKI